MPLYFRSDLRGPSEIFEKGFENRELRTLASESSEHYKYPESLINWSIFAMVSPLLFYDNHRATDALSSGGVCMTINFWVLPVFPVDSVLDTYLYFISLPPPIPIVLSDFQSENPKSFGVFCAGIALGDYQSIFTKPQYLKYVNQGMKKVFNLYNLQYEQSLFLLNWTKTTGQTISYSDALETSWSLFGAEHIVSHVDRTDIAFVVKCTNRQRTGTDTFGTTFQIMSDSILFNPHYDPHDMPYKAEDRRKAIQMLHKIPKDVSLHSATRSWGKVWDFL